MAYTAPSSPQSPLQQLLEDLNFLRAKDRRQRPVKADDHTGGWATASSASTQGNTHWTDLFVRHFIFQSDIPTTTSRRSSSSSTAIPASTTGTPLTGSTTQLDADESDDLLFFVRKKPVRGSGRRAPRFTAEVSVMRKDSRRLPIGDPDVDWLETVYLNLIVHQFVYTLTLAICTRTSPKELQVLRRHTQRVYASPSRRQMDGKGEREDWTYPEVCFMVDNFDEVFGDMVARDGEMVCVELVASERPPAGASASDVEQPQVASLVQSVLFLGSIRYDALKRVYDSRQSASLSARMVQRMRFGLFGARDGPRCEFVRMNGPHGKGHAEMAVTKPKGSGVETPTSEPGYAATDMLWMDDDDDDDARADCGGGEWSDADEEVERRPPHRRRLMSDPSASLNAFSRFSWRAGGSRNPSVSATSSSDAANKARSQNEGLDTLANELSEIAAGDLTDELDDGAYNPLWTSRGCTQTFHFWKEHRRQQSVAMNAFCTYVSLPWWCIARDLLSSVRGRPMLTF